MRSQLQNRHETRLSDGLGGSKGGGLSYAEIAIQTVEGHRRAMDYLAGREDIRAKRIGLVGFSMGGMDAFYLMSVELRIRNP